MGKKLLLRNDISEIAKLTDFTKNLVETMNLPIALSYTLNLVLEEVVSNIILYGYPCNESHSLEIKAEKITDQLLMTIKDSGKPFDPTQMPEANIALTAEERPVGGLGIHIVRKMMDEVHYERKGQFNILTLIKNV